MKGLLNEEGKKRGRTSMGPCPEVQKETMYIRLTHISLVSGSIMLGSRRCNTHVTGLSSSVKVTPLPLKTPRFFCFPDEPS